MQCGCFALTKAVIFNVINERNVFAVCGTGQFRCASGGCIDERMVCDAIIQCFDGSDEAADCGNLFFNLFFFLSQHRLFLADS